MSVTGIDGYRDYLARRDGEADLLNRRLASREEFFAAMEADPVRSKRRIDRGVFARNLRRRRPEAGLDRRTLFLLATAKLNQAERFGVVLGEIYGNNSGDDVPPERVYMELEEHYHTRLLAYVLNIFDLPFQVVAPPLVMRQFVKTAVFLPERMSFMFVGAAEMAGCIMFHELRRIGMELFADEPEVAARIERLYSEISRTRWVTSATARRAVPRWSGRSCAACTHESDDCLHDRLLRPAFSPSAGSFTTCWIDPSTSTSSRPVCQTRRSSPPTRDGFDSRYKSRADAETLELTTRNDAKVRDTTTCEYAKVVDGVNMPAAAFRHAAESPSALLQGHLLSVASGYIAMVIGNGIRYPS
jgi:hypothetical protein